MKRPGSPASLLFRLIAPVCAVFILTILAMIASIFGNPEAPLAKWLDRHVGTILTVEFVATIGLSVLAMFVDRIRTLRSAHLNSPSADVTTQQQNSIPAESPDATVTELHSTETNDSP
jgi:hypothetical protein